MPRTKENDALPLDEARCDECGAPAFTRWFEVARGGRNELVMTVCEPCNDEYVAESRRQREAMIACGYVIGPEGETCGVPISKCVEHACTGVNTCTGGCRVHGPMSPAVQGDTSLALRCLAAEQRITELEEHRKQWRRTAYVVLDVAERAIRALEAHDEMIARQLRESLPEMLRSPHAIDPKGGESR